MRESIRQGCRGWRWAGWAALGAVFLLGPVTGDSPLRAAEEPVPLAREDAGAAGEWTVSFLWKREAAYAALRQGLPSVANRLYRQASESLPEGDVRRDGIDIELATALLALGRFGEAESVLERFPDDAADAVALRRAMLAWNGRRWEEMARYLDRVTEDVLSREDRGWYAFLRGYRYELQGEAGEAESWYQRAEEESVSPAQRAEFVIARNRVLLAAGDVDEAGIERLQAEADEHRGTEEGFRLARKYILALESLGRRDEALEALSAERDALPAEVAGELRDRFLLLAGVVHGSAEEAGRSAYESLLRHGETRRVQRAALYELGRDLKEDEEWERLRSLLTELIEAEEAHPLVDELLTFRSRLFFEQRDFEAATDDAQTVLSQYPGSRLKKDALRLLAHAAWEERKFRTAADYVTRLRDETPEGERRAELGVLVADCYFRAEDYRNAADAYGNVLREEPRRISAGLLVFQRVEAELRGDRPNRAREHLDDAVFETPEDLDYLWQAEWNLLKLMQRRGRMDDAYTRVTELLEDREDYPLPHALRVRFTWLQAQLSLEAGRPEDTLALVEMVFSEMAREEAETALSEDLKQSVRTYARLMQAQALLETGEAEEAVTILQELRENDRGSEPAVYSYLVEARYHAAAGRSGEARQLLVALAETYPESPYAPIALYEAAVIADRNDSGEGHHERAIGRLERLVETYPDHELAFYARLKQAHILREMNRFGTARQIYESLDNRYPDHADWFRVKISLADTLLAQGEGGDESYFERALVTLERLYDLPHLTPDMKAEAGFKYGFAYQKTGDNEQAEEVYWLVIAAILENEERAAAIGSKGRYWVARSVLHLGRLLEDSGRQDEARRAYALISIHGLPGESLVRSRLTPLTAR